MGLITLIQFVPSHLIINPPSPTACPSFELTISTDHNVRVPTIFGLSTMFQIVPFQWIRLLMPVYCALLPTAHPSFELTIFTDSQGLLIGLSTRFQFVPFHLIIMPPYPTAHPSVELTIFKDVSMSAVGVVTLFQLVPSHLIID